MAKALKVFVILLLVMSAGAAFLGWMLFNQRVQAKGRVQKLEQSVIGLTQKLAAPKDPYIEEIKQKIDPNTLMSYADMDSQLKLLETITDNRYEEIYATKDELKKTKDELLKTQQELAQTKLELENARKEIANLQEQVKAKEAEIAAAKQKIGELETEIAGLNQKIEEIKQQIAKLEEEKLQLADDNQRLKVEIRNATPQDQPLIKRGTAGHVVAVNPDWNFVVIDIGLTNGLQRNAVMILHRGPQVLGRVRVTMVRDTSAIADIDREWPGAVAPETGDQVLY